MNPKVKQIIDAWPVLTAVALLVFIPIIKDIVSDVVAEDLGTTQTVVDMNTQIAANTDNIEDHDDDVARIEKKIDALGLKVDRLVEIMLAAD